MHQLTDLEKARSIGIAAYAAELDEKVRILKMLLEHYDDGRRKSFFCIAVNLLQLEDIVRVLAQIEDEIQPDACLKEKAAAAAGLFEKMAEKRCLSLKLRKKTQSRSLLPLP